MNLREFYSRAFLTALPIAADAYFKHSDTLDLEFLGDLEDVDSDEIIARLAHDIAYKAAMTWGTQLEGWARSDKDPDREIPKSTVDMITFKDEDPASGNN